MRFTGSERKPSIDVLESDLVDARRVFEGISFTSTSTLRVVEEFRS